MTFCASVSEFLSLVIILKGVHVGFEAQDAGIGEVGGSVKVQAR